MMLNNTAEVFFVFEGKRYCKVDMNTVRIVYSRNIM